MQQDIRDIAYIDHKDVIGLNFIQSDGRYVFRRHFRQGLRSHILEILDPDDIDKEQAGTMVDGIRHFPQARPRNVLRIFRTRFTCLAEALAEIQRVKIIERFLTPDCVAQSIEMIVEYHGPQARSPLLCGFQEYVTGVILDPWILLRGPALLRSLYDSLAVLERQPLLSRAKWIEMVRENGSRFVGHIRTLIERGSHVPDLAGVGNVLITSSGRLKLVDINNISRVVYDDTIRLDDRAYPVCDKSIEALALIEEKLLDRTIKLSDPIYGLFLTQKRKKNVGALEKGFRV